MVAVVLAAVAALLRVWPLQALESRLAWLTFYPAVMVSAIYGGFSAGMTTTGISCFVITFFWHLIAPRPFVADFADWLGLAVFVLTGTMISASAEAMRMANVRAMEAKKRAEAANQAKSVFLAAMSHELRTPLNAILGFSEIMRGSSGLSEEHRKSLEIINASGGHLLDLINDVLDMAKIESGKIVVENDAFDIDELMHGVLELMRVRALEKDLEISFEQSPGVPRFIRSDAVKLRQILINLVGNAIKFTTRGRIVLRLGTFQKDEKSGMTMHIEVEDTGIGIAERDLERIFEPFVQAGSGTFQKGTGLGLSIVQKYAKLMGGGVQVKSLLGQGSVFIVDLPVERAGSIAETRAVDGSGKIVGIASGQRDYRVLIVEDQAENWLLLKNILEKVGFTVRVAENGALGVDLFEIWQPHFIWMDVRMPVMNGLEATAHIRKLDGGGAVKIAALTASVFIDERNDILASGVNDLVCKPFRAEEIYACMAKHLGVRYVYGESQPLPSVAPELPAALDGLMASIPPDSLEELREALIFLEPERINEIVTKISETNPRAGAALAYHAERLSYTKIFEAIKRMTDGRN